MGRSAIQAIPTEYAGCRFRSRLEARWAVFFDELDLTWEYEPEGFILADGDWYLPDFWLPDLQLWLEVKGREPTTWELEKVRRLEEGTGSTAVLFSGVFTWRPGRSESVADSVLVGGLWWSSTFGPIVVSWLECSRCKTVDVERLSTFSLESGGLTCRSCRQVFARDRSSRRRPRSRLTTAHERARTYRFTR